MNRFIILISTAILLFLIPHSSLFSQTNNETPTQNAFPHLKFKEPVDFTFANDGTDRIFVVEKRGKIIVFENNPNTKITSVFLDITDRVLNGGECGLLGLTFHPKYKTNGYFFVNYTTPKPTKTVIARFQVDLKNPNLAIQNSALVILEIDQPYQNHNGGQIVFGPDGFLYIGMGDGGSGGDPQNYAQNLQSLLGKMLRIDVDKTQNGLNYAIPASNPIFKNAPDYRKEIYAYGLRNPWRFSFDTKTKKLWTGDVGQGMWEEIDIIESGGNYGWRIYEGKHIFKKIETDEKTLIPPVFEYQHTNGNISITGGYVYHGKRRSELEDAYIYGDYNSKNIWAFNLAKNTNTHLAVAADRITAFGVDSKNELYILGGGGLIYEFTPNIKCPTELQIVATDTTAELAWADNSENETGFLIEKKSSDNIYTKVATVAANVKTYKDKIQKSTDFEYRVTAFNKTDVSNYSNTVSTNK